MNSDGQPNIGRHVDQKVNPEIQSQILQPITLRWAVRVAGSILVRPSLWRPLGRAAVSMAPRRWWLRRPFLPLPPRDYLTFRLQTQYGGAGTNAADPSDVLKYLRWLRR
jgi:hypothetical protein